MHEERREEHGGAGTRFFGGDNCRNGAAKGESANGNHAVPLEHRAHVRHFFAAIELVQHVVDEIKTISSKPVAWLIYTHYHGDHNLGAGALRAAWPAMRIVSTEATKTNMAGAPMEYAKTYDNGYQETLDFARQQHDDPATPAAGR